MLFLVAGRVIVDPTTYVFFDGNQALNYKNPRKKDETPKCVADRKWLIGTIISVVLLGIAFINQFI